MTIIHCVFCDFLADGDDASRQTVLQGLEKLALSLPGVLAFDHGPNRDFENKTPSFDAGFIIRFTDEAALNAYAQNPEHQALGGQLCELCNGGADGITVFDLEV